MSERPPPRSELPPSSPSWRADASARKPEAPGLATSRARILVVDDSAICLEATAMMLEEAGYEVSMVDSPFGLSSALSEAAPDLVLVDVSMPGLTGDKLVEITLRNRGANRAMMILLHSDRSEHELRSLARACGAAGYIRKTSDARLLVREVERYLRG